MLPGLEAGPVMVTSEVSAPEAVEGDLRMGGALAPEAPPAPAGAPETAPVAGVRQWEGRLGGTWLSRIGAVLFFLGAGFFLKHAFEQEWIGPKGRVLAGLVAGVAMLAGA